MFSIIICTHNRCEVLNYCLKSFIPEYKRETVEFEILVVDNNSIDNTHSVVLIFESILPIHYIKETNVGLSYARNRGFKEAKFEWIIYIDDDAMLHNGFMDRAKWVISNYTFDGFGGRCFPWYLAPRPLWLSDDFGLMPEFLKEVGLLPKGLHFQGMVMAFKRLVLLEVGGFPLDLGMIGMNVGYGEENWVQDRMREKGFLIGFDPQLKVDHLVASYKYKLSWHLRRHYAKGKTAAIIEKRRFVLAVIRFFKSVLITGKQLVFNFPKMLGSRDYYYQNYILDSVSYFMRSLGYLLK